MRVALQITSMGVIIILFTGIYFTHEMFIAISFEQYTSFEQRTACKAVDAPSLKAPGLAFSL